MLWPAVICLLEKTVRPPAKKCATLAALAVAFAVYRAAVVGRFDASRIYYGLDTHIDGLLLGSALAYLVTTVPTFPSATDRSFRLFSRVVVPAAIIGLLLVLSFLTWTNPLMGQLGFFCVAVASVVLVADLTLSPFSFLAPALSAPTLVYFGKISYGLYLLHYPIFDFVNYLAYGKNIPYLALVPVKFGVAFVFAAASYHLVEVRFLRLRHRFTTGSAPSLSSP
jgi:peptidoglycan/LPS O-acetylase OafA/YrhL